MPQEQQNILFYAKDRFSLHSLEILKSNELLKKQFILFDLLDTSKRIPQKIIELKKAPVLILNGFNVPIVGEDVLNWFKNNSLNNRKPANTGSKNIKTQTSADELETIDSLNGQFSTNFAVLQNDEYIDEQIITHSSYSLLNGQTAGNNIPNSMQTGPEANYETKTDVSHKISSKIDQYKLQRDQDVQRDIPPPHIDFTKIQPGQLA